MRRQSKRVLLLGYGNPGRLDDGLGPAFASTVSLMRIPGVRVEIDYQLQVEDAALAAEYDVVLFADADTSCENRFRLERLESKADLSFSTHSVSPQALLAMAQEHFGARTEAYVLGIRGHEFNGFGERLSRRARANLAAALAYMEPVLRDRDFEENTTGPHPRRPVSMG